MYHMQRAGLVLASAALLALVSCANLGTGISAAANARAVVASADRSAADRAADLRRQPEQLLTFAGVTPGMRILDVSTGPGYSTELLARAVGPGGVVYGQDGPKPSERAATGFNARMAQPAMAAVVRVLRDFDDPLPPGTAPLDRVFILNAYHDFGHMKVDRTRMNARLFESLRSGGELIIGDHSALAGAPIETGGTLHRIDEALVRRELEAAGFRFAGSADFLRHAEDPRTERVFGSKTPVDEFMLKFVRP